MKKAGIVYFTTRGRKVAERVKDTMMSDGYCVCIRDKEKDKSLSKWTETAFLEYEMVVFVSATGIAVRTIAPFLKSKITDPGVVCIDDNGKFIIPLVSGHIGGANHMAEKLAEKLNGIPVVTTATDINGRIAIDSWAKDNNLIIEDMNLAKECAMRLLEGKPVAMVSMLPVKVNAKGIELIFSPKINPMGDLTEFGDKLNYKKYDFGINISWRTDNYFRHELKLVPKGLILGIGCRKGTKKETIEKVSKEILMEKGICFSSISTVASIDLKKDEEGLLEFSRDEGLKFVTFTAKELAMAQGEFPRSEFVSKVTGVDNVCQRAAVIAGPDGEVLIEKTAREGVTISVAIPRRLKEDMLYVK